MNTDFPLLIEVLPELGIELKKLLKKTKQFHLAESIDSLQIIKKCGCNDNSCASFYTAPKPNGGYGDGHNNLILTPKYGFLILDVVNDAIKFVEILNRPKYKKLLNQI